MGILQQSSTVCTSGPVEAAVQRAYTPPPPSRLFYFHWG